MRVSGAVHGVPATWAPPPCNSDSAATVRKAESTLKQLPLQFKGEVCMVMTVI